MAVSRRAFLHGLSGVAALPLVRARGLEASANRTGWPAPNGLIRLDSNENPNGPSVRALEAIQRAFGETNRYPRLPTDALTEAVAKHHGVKPENVLIGCGSTDHLRLAVDAFTSQGRGLVTAAPSFETPATWAAVRGIPVAAVPVDSGLGLDLDAMAKESIGAGLVYFCNPNNPTGTVHSKAAVSDFARHVLAQAPATYLLIDEAYFEYVDDPDYGTLIPMALEDPRVFVLRTFSKVHGMAGLRVGYAIGKPETILAMKRFQMPLSVSGVAAAAAVATLGDEQRIPKEQQLNRAARDFTRRWFGRYGFTVAPSATNFMMVAIGRPIDGFKKACEDRGVAVGRPFPPLLEHARISIGTMEEMQRAVTVFGQILGVSTSGQ
jgi:histidinol-phosphate aminotransferase